MEALKKKIETDGLFLRGNIVKVDSFINHQIDPDLMIAMGNSLYEHFKHLPITKIVTIESSGIPPALIVASKMHVPLLFMKKSEPSTMLDPLFTTVFSYTKNKSYTLCVEKAYLSPSDRILFIDDFLANGEAFQGAETLIHQAGASILGVGILIEKAFQKGHAYILNRGYDLYALASIRTIYDNQIEWIES